MEAALSIDAMEPERAAALRLAEVISLAARIEPHLLRKGRLKLVPEANAASEADLWFSPLVATRSATGIVLETEVAELLRGRLAQDRERARGSRELVRKAHHEAPPTVRLHEHVLWLSTLHSDEAQAGFEQELDGVLRAMLDEPSRTADLARWVVRTLPLLPAAVRTSAAGWRLWLAATSRVPGHAQAQDEPPPDGLAGMLDSVLPAAPQNVAVGARLTDQGLELSEPPADATHTIGLPRSSPLLVDLSLTDPDEVVHAALQPGSTALVPLGTLRVRTEDRGAVLPQRAPVVKLATGGRLLAVGHADGGVEIRELPEGTFVSRHQSAAPGVFSIDPPGERLLVSGGKWGPLFLDPSSGESLSSIDWTGSEPTAMAFDGRGRRFAVGSADGNVRIYLSEGEPLGTWETGGDPASELAFDASGKVIAVAAGSLVHLLDAGSLEPIATLSHDGAVRAVAFNPREEGTVVTATDSSLTWTSGPSWAEKAERFPIGAVDLSWNSDALSLALAGVDGAVRIWEMALGSLGIVTPEAAPPLAVVFGPEGSPLDTQGYQLWIGGGPEYAELSTALGDVWRLESRDPDVLRETLQGEVRALLELTQAIALDFHVLAQGARAEGLSQDQAAASYGRGTILPAEQFDEFRRAAEWALWSTLEAVVGDLERSGDWRRWRDGLSEVGAPGFVPPPARPAAAASAILGLLRRLLREGETAFGPDPYESRYPVPRPAIDLARRLGVAIGTGARTSSGSSTFDPSAGELYLAGEYGEVAKAFEQAADLLEERLPRWEWTPRLDIKLSDLRDGGSPDQTSFR